jgi:hypothetical protein
LATNESIEFANDCTKKLRLVQLRSAPPRLPVTAKEVHERVRATLQRAIRAELLKTASYDVPRLLWPITRSTWLDGFAYQFSCGPTRDELKDPTSRDCLVRIDNSVISFSVTVGQRTAHSILELIAYRFDITLPHGPGPRFVRFDLDRPNEGHDAGGLRAHIHPGLHDGRLPSPILDPVEVLHFLIAHLQVR